MARSTLVWLALAVALLAALFLWQDRRESARAQDEDVPLFQGLDTASVTAVRIESVERDVHLRAERTASGGWVLVDPVSVPADSELFEYLVQTALARRGASVPRSEGDAQSLNLDPPRIILELESQSNGTAVRQKLEIGALDLDGQRMYVRARGRILRTLRDLDTTLSRQLDDYKSPRIVELDPREIIEVHRAGKLVLARDAEATDLAFDALVEEQTWHATLPIQAALDPVAMSLWVQGATRLEARRYIEDGGAAPADYGLDPPEFSVRLSTAKNAQAELSFGRSGHAANSAWFARLSGKPFLIGVDDHAVKLLAAPLEDLLDRRLMRRRSAPIDGITFHSNDRELLIGRTGKAWNVSEKRGHGSFTTPYPAEQSRVDDVIGRMEAVEFADFVFDRQFEPSPGGEILSIQSGSDAQGGAIGVRFTSESGAVALEYQRFGDSVVALVDPSLLELLRTPLEDLMSLHLLDVLEVDQTALRIAGLGAERRYVRGPGGVWAAPDLAVRAQELDQVLDSLLFLRAERHLPIGAPGALVDPVTIDFTNRRDGHLVYTVGRTPGESGEVAVDVDGRRAILAKKDQGLHAKLVALLR